MRFSTSVRLRAAALVSGLALLAGGPAAALDRLSDKGVLLDVVEISPGVTDLSRTVDLGGDRPSATYLIARQQNNQPLQRTNTGYWIPWNGDPATLIDNRFQESDGKIVYKIVAEDLSTAFLPVVFTLAYRAGGTLKTGSLTVNAR